MSENKSIHSNSKRQKRNQPKIPKKITESYLHNSGLYYLQKYSASSAHFKTVMSRKAKRSCMHHEEQNYDDCVALIDKLVEKFVRTGLLNDDVYLQGMVSSYRKKGLSERMIIQKLNAKGMKQDQVLPFIKEYDSQTTDDNAEQKAAAIFCRRKKLGSFRIKPLQDNDENKEMAKLARAGFRFDVIKQILSMTTDDLENLIYN